MGKRGLPVRDEYLGARGQGSLDSCGEPWHKVFVHELCSAQQQAVCMLSEFRVIDLQALHPNTRASAQRLSLPILKEYKQLAEAA